MAQLQILEPKDPNDEVDYAVNWSRYLTRVGDTILTSTWPVITPVGLTVLSDTHDGTRAVIKLGGGTPGTYRLTNRIITTPGARQRDKTITIRVRDR